MKRLSLVFGATCLFTLLGAATAHAAESPTAGHASVAGLLGYGFEDGVNLGLGVRGGYTLPMNVYLGGTFVYHFGESQDLPFGVEASTNLFYLGVEGGYDIAVDPVVIRPYLGVGLANATVSVGDVSESESRFAAWPGGTLIYPIGNAFVGGDLRFLIVEDDSAFSMFATGGLQF
jgi:hypothetical protein